MQIYQYIICRLKADVVEFKGSQKAPRQDVVVNPALFAFVSTFLLKTIKNCIL